MLEKIIKQDKTEDKKADDSGEFKSIIDINLERFIASHSIFCQITILEYKFHYGKLVAFVFDRYSSLHKKA